MPIWFESLTVLFVILIVVRHIKRGSNFLKRYFIPSSLIGGLVALFFGPQLLGTIPANIAAEWGNYPRFLINIVFAGLFLGHTIPKPAELWKKSAPMLAFGNTLAWGQYIIGILLTLCFLGPVFGAPSITGALIEVGFEGGHGTASGLAPTFAVLGWRQGADIALGLATISVVTAVVSCLIIINVYNHKRRRILNDAMIKSQQQKLIRSGYSITKFADKLDANTKEVAITVLLFGLSIVVGWSLQQTLISAESLLLGPFTNLRFFKYLPLFPLAMIGGIIVQLVLKFTHKAHLIRRGTIRTFCAIALDLLIVTAIATASLSSIWSNLAIFITLSLAGVIWILSAFFFFAPRYFRRDWFENGITNVGQSMGMTATGLLMNRLVDPGNKTHAREAFMYKQLAFEPFMGGGIITAMMLVLLSAFGQIPILILSITCFSFWVYIGLTHGRSSKRKKRRDKQEAGLAKLAYRLFNSNN